MRRLSSLVEMVENKLIELWKKYKPILPKVLGIVLIILYAYGFIVRSVISAFDNVWNQADKPLFTLDPIANISAVFTPTGIGILFFVAIMYCLLTRKGMSLITGYKTVKDKERGIEILPEGTHGTSGWMNKKEIGEVLETGGLDTLDKTLFGKLENGNYVAMKDMLGMSRNVIIYGAPGTGKSRGFVMPFAMQAARRGESIIMIDPKAEFFEMYSEFLKEQGYYIRAYNLLDLASSDGWNCIVDISDDINLVQNVAEIIISNTSNKSERADFWEKAEKNLLMALLHYVRTLTYPGTDKLLLQEERSLGTIYKILSTTSVEELDARFRTLPPEHPALPPYGIFRQAHKQIWGNIVIGLGNRLNVFQNKLVDDITRHNEIDLTLPGKQKCAYFCIISDQDSSLEFLSSMFFSLLFVRLFDFARSQPTRRLPVCVNVLMDEYCNISLLESKKIFSVARSRNINIQAVVQSVAQLSNRYPHNEWQEIIGDCDYQLFLGCNDAMTAEFISDQCGEITVRVNNSMLPMMPLFSPVLNTTRPFTQNKTSTGRPLMMPDEVRRLQKDKAILLVRGAKPLLLNKITPEEHPSFKELKYCKSIDYVPKWRRSATVAQSNESNEKSKSQKSKSDKKLNAPQYQVQIPLPEKVSEEYVPDEEELNLSPKIDISKQIDCRTLQEVDPKDI